MKVLLQLILISATLLLISCRTYKTFHITVYEPAEINLPERLKRLLLLNTLPPTGTGMHYSIYSEEYIDSIYLDTLAAYYALNRLAGVLASSSRFETVFPQIEDQKQYTLHNAHNPHPEDLLKNLTVKYQADAVVLLENLNHLIRYRAEVGRWGYHQSLMEISLTSKWKIYDPTTSSVMDEKTIEIAHRYRWTGIWGWYDDDLFYTGREVFFQAAEEAGENYGRRISPHLISDRRIIFHQGNRYLRKGYQQALSGDWTAATDYWLRSIHHPSALIKARGAFNLALAAEMNGQLDDAIHYAGESYRIFPDTLNHSYLLILQNRKQKLPLILQQVDPGRN